MSESAPAVGIAHDPLDIGRAVDDALGHLDLSFARGKTVAVKPNETYATAEDRSGVTQPDTLRAVLRALRAAGAAQLVVTGGSGAAETDEVFRVAGLMQIVEEEGAEFFDHNRLPVSEVALRYAPDKDVDGPQRSVMVNPRVLEYDALVSLAQLKLHSTATVTLSLKNVAMSFPAADHYGHPRHKEDNPNHFFDDMHSFIAAMAARFRIHLAIVVGHPAMIGNGPLGGHAVETGLVIASRDPLAADVVGARLLGFGVQAVRHLWEAERLAVGSADLKRMGFPGLGMREGIEIFTEAAYGERLTFEHA